MQYVFYLSLINRNNFFDKKKAIKKLHLSNTLFITYPQDKITILKLEDLRGNVTLVAEKKHDFDNFFYAHSKSNTKFISRLLYMF